MPIEFNLENMNYFIDCNREAPFEVIRGEGSARSSDARRATVPDLEGATARRCSPTASSASIRG